jgi:long-subunit acyl-CoA synthetase (AMP-forming)
MIFHNEISPFSGMATDVDDPHCEQSLQSVILCPDEWTPASGLLTAAQKLQRKVIQTKFAAQIKVTFFPFT